MLGGCADWVQYHAELGVEGMHLYMVAADFVLAPRGGGYTHTPGNYKPVSIENHRCARQAGGHPCAQGLAACWVPNLLSWAGSVLLPAVASSGFHAPVPVWQQAGG